MPENRSKPLGTIVPSLIYDDVSQAVEWLCRVFQFTERLRVIGPDGRVGHAQLEYGLGGFLLGESRPGFAPPGPNATAGVSLLVQVNDVDQHYEHSVQQGAEVSGPPTTYPYGECQYGAVDLAGYHWTFTQSVDDAKPEDWGATPVHIVPRYAALPRPRFCYVDIPAADLAESVKFYESVFGWAIRHRDTPRSSFDTANGDISGAWVTGRPPSREPGLLPYIWVDNIDVTVAVVQQHGGEIVSTVQLDSPGGEWIATFRDPAGNLLGLYQEGPRHS